MSSRVFRIPGSRRPIRSSTVKCDKCDNEATVHEVMIKGGKRHEKHLCEQCAKSEGLPAQSHTPITQLLTQYMTAQTDSPAAAPASAAAATVAPTTCACCGLLYTQFRHTGLLGCPECYNAFESQLGPLLARAHEGGTHHVGKSPRRVPVGPRSSAAAAPAASAAARAEETARHDRINLLKQRLAEAVAAEQYEKAAKLRDELALLESAPALPAPAATPKRARKTPPKNGGAA